MDSHISDVLRAVGRPAAAITGGEGSILVLPYGGRVLGLYAPGDVRNFLWTNPLLRDIESARQYFASEAWKNSGGDRTWLSPEIDFFLPNFPSLDAYYQPRELDPGSFLAEITDTSVRLKMDFTMTPLRNSRPVQLRLTRSVGLTANPLRHDSVLSKIEGVQFAGYFLHTSLEILDPSPTTPSIGLWSLLQLPHGGEMFLPTYSTCEPTITFGEVPTSDLGVEPRAVRYRMRTAGAQKISLPALSCPGRAGYHYQSEGVSQLVIRNFSVNPSGDYVDVPWRQPKLLGDAVQACNVSVPEVGNFSELEYHVPAIGGLGGRQHSDDHSQVWAFRGDFDQINTIAEKLLGISL